MAQETKRVVTALTRHGDYDKAVGDTSIFAHEGRLNGKGAVQMAKSAAILSNYNIVEWGCSPLYRAFDSMMVARGKYTGLLMPLRPRHFYGQLAPLNQHFFQRIKTAWEDEGREGEPTLCDLYEFDPNVMDYEGQCLRDFAFYKASRLNDGQTFSGVTHGPIIDMAYRAANKDLVVNKGDKSFNKGDVVVFEWLLRGDEVLEESAKHFPID